MARLQALVFSCLVALVAAQARVCNNSPAFCDLVYGTFAMLGAHDSPFVRNSTNNFTVAADQVYTSLQQLDAGVRLLSAQVHRVNNADGTPDYRLCHTLCQLYDAGSLLDWLKEIKGWLDEHPDDVVTLLLVNSDDADATTLGGIYKSAGLDTYSYTPPPYSKASPLKWPTLDMMIDDNQRLVNFIASINSSNPSSAPYLFNEFDWIFENNYDIVNPNDFSCEPQRPPSLNGNTAAALSQGYFPLLNHFRYDNISGIEIPSVENVNITNAPLGAPGALSGPGNLGVAAANCTSVYGRVPFAILTDFSNVGPAIETIDRLNNVTGKTSGRLELPDTIADSEADPSPTSILSAAASTASVASSGTGTATAASGSSAATTSSGSAKSAANAFTPMLPLVSLGWTIGLLGQWLLTA